LLARRISIIYKPLSTVCDFPEIKKIDSSPFFSGQEFWRDAQNGDGGGLRFALRVAALEGSARIGKFLYSAYDVIVTHTALSLVTKRCDNKRL
jgi:hypothetical protein